MRLSDKDHNIYAPGQFLEIAKDYHLYLQLSQLMIQKVLELFRDRKETVFLNLSAYDISSSASRSLLYDLLSDLRPGRVSESPLRFWNRKRSGISMNGRLPERDPQVRRQDRH